MLNEVFWWTGAFWWLICCLGLLRFLYYLGHCLVLTCSFILWLIRSAKISKAKWLSVPRAFVAAYGEMLDYSKGNTKYTTKRGHWKGIGDWVIYPEEKEEQ